MFQLPTWQKPVRGTQLNKSHPLSKDMVVSVIANEGSGKQVWDHVGNKSVSFLETDGTITWVGDYLRFSTGGQDWKVLNFVDAYSSLCTSTGQTQIFKIQVDVDANAQGFTQHEDGAYGFKFEWNSGSDRWEFWNSTTGSNWAGRNAPTNSSPFGEIETVAATFDGNNAVKIYRDGLLIYSGTLAITGPSNNSGSRLLFGANDYDDGSKGLQGKLWYAHAWNRVLLAEEIALVTREPYCMFQQPRIVVVPAAPGGISIPLIMQQMNQFDGGQLTV